MTQISVRIIYDQKTRRPTESPTTKLNGLHASLVVQDPFLDAETVDLADIYLPAAMWGEKTGCVTNADRSVNLLLKAVDPPGEARSDFDIFVEVADRLGFKDRDGALIPFKEPRDAFEEWR